MVKALTDEQTKELLLDLLSKTAAAHGVYENEQLAGQYDEQWPTWYAQHMTEQLSAAGYAITEASHDS